MNPLKLSAQFAAYVWYTEVRQGSRTHDEALRFARENWAAFRPSAREGWGRLLMRVANVGRVPRGGVRRHQAGRPTNRASAGLN